MRDRGQRGPQQQPNRGQDNRGKGKDKEKKPGKDQ
jgi:hypothetical protein